MNLQPINPPLRNGQCVYCMGCSRAINAVHPDAVVDLDGPAFEAYYHAGCAPKPAQEGAA